MIRYACFLYDLESVVCVNVQDGYIAYVFRIDWDCCNRSKFVYLFG